ncbi:MAG: D-alanine--D-alanine ligase [Candidatus Pelagibacter sp. TMED64]|nr:D-alanine--D-alanine ligase [Candidatus Pelagibacter sp.]OUU67302.1 MAG: D-alanine--D-alanine ligase [Candidatus Pelagibacter sp. TMED64]|tara:strand:+ start:364 stop:1290 length:927 start_codon:yes stop_codon:yes gene_type:complete
MNKKKDTIAILMGGLSDERNISILTGKACCKALIKKGYKINKIDPKDNLLYELKKTKPKKVFNALHGRYGEDGFVQNILEYLKIPYTHSGVLASTLAMDKVLSKIIFIKNNFLVPKYILLENVSKNEISKKLKTKNIKFPTVIKPTNEGSSLGVYICKNLSELYKNYKKLRNYKKVIVEQYIPGREIQVAVKGNKALGAIELVPKRKFYDYKAKYSTRANTKHIMPAPINKKKYNEVLLIAKKAHKVLGCKGITRSDFRFYKNKFYLLELNTQPGMTNLSLVPEIALNQGIKFEELIDWMIKDASLNR